jgi:hypothetical protein
MLLRTVGSFRIPRLPSFPAIGRIQRLLEEFEAKGSRLQRMLLRLNWPLPGHLPAALVDDITLAYDREGATVEEIEALFVNFYSPERLSELIGGWRAQGFNPRRLTIAVEAVRAHNEGRFELSVPALLPQIEGTIAEMFGHSGTLSMKELRTYVRSAFRGESRSDKIAVAFVVNVLHDQFRWGARVPHFSRHAILHGADVDYATAAKSLKLILIFDQLQQALRYVATSAGRRYHSPNCRIVGRMRRGRRVFASEDDAAEEGLAPCSICLPYLGGSTRPVVSA